MKKTLEAALRILTSKILVSFLGITVLSLQPAVYGTCVNVFTGIAVGVKDDCNKKQKKKRKQKRNRSKETSDATDQQSVLVHGGVIAWADRPMGGGVVAWADRRAHSSVVAWAQPRCDSTNIVIQLDMCTQRAIPTYCLLPPINRQLITGTSQSQPMTMTNERRKPSRPRSSAPHSGVVRWVNRSTSEADHLASLEEPHPRVWCVKHSTRFCGCYGTQTRPSNAVRVAHNDVTGPGDDPASQ